MGDHRPLYIAGMEKKFMEENRYALEMQDITVEFPGVIANDHVSIELKKGEVVGDWINGANDENTDFVV